MRHGKSVNRFGSGDAFFSELAYFTHMNIGDKKRSQGRNIHCTITVQFTGQATKFMRDFREHYLKTPRWKTNRIPTPVEIATSAMLKMGLKKVKYSPPQIGIQEGNSPANNGK